MNRLQTVHKIIGKCEGLSELDKAALSILMEASRGAVSVAWDREELSRAEVVLARVLTLVRG